MKKKFFGFLTAILTLGVLGGTAFVAASDNIQKEDAAYAATIGASTKLYLKPNSNWRTDGARFAAYFFGNGEAWVSMVDSDADGIYEVTSPTKSYTNVIFCRMKGSATANNWDNKMNQTSDLTYDGTNNLYTVKEGTWDKGGGSWSGFRIPSLDAGEDIEMYVDATRKLEPSVNYVDNPNYTYENTNDECVSVDDEGNIKALAVGSATITVNETTNNLSDTITVTVKSLDNKRIIYLENGWYTNYFYAWDSNGNNKPWPGQIMDYDPTNMRHYIILDSNYTWTNCIFNDGSSSQTADLTMPDINNKNETYDRNNGGKWVDRMYEGVQTFYIDFDKWSGEEAVPAIAFKSIFNEMLVLGEKVDGSTVYKFTSPSSMNSYSLILARLSESTPSWDVRLNQSNTILASDSSDTNCFISTGFDNKNLIAELPSLTYTTSRLTYSNVEAWANLINNQCTGVTQNEMDDTAWSKAKTTYNDLTSGEKILVNTALADEFGSKLQHALATYYHLVTERKFEDFANRVDGSSSTRGLMFNDNNEILLIVIISLGIITTAALFFYRKKRAQA